jgi:hypothetical protein
MNETQNKNKLYFGNLPRAFTQLQLEEELSAHTKGEARRAGTQGGRPYHWPHVLAACGALGCILHTPASRVLTHLHTCCC